MNSDDKFRIVRYEKYAKALKENEELKAKLNKEINSVFELGDRVEKLEVKLSELQPFERGTEGWARNQEGEWVKCIYIARYRIFDIVETDTHVCTLLADFTTSNPHKNETVFSGVLEGDVNNLHYWTNAFEKPDLGGADAVFFYKHSNPDIGGFLDVYGEGVLTRYKVTQLGDDLKAKFEDPNNTKYIDLTK